MKMFLLNESTKDKTKEISTEEVFSLILDKIDKNEELDIAVDLNGIRVNIVSINLLNHNMIVIKGSNDYKGDIIEAEFFENLYGVRHLYNYLYNCANL